MRGRRGIGHRRREIFEMEKAGEKIRVTEDSVFSLKQQGSFYFAVNGFRSYSLYDVQNIPFPDLPSILKKNL